MYTLFISTFNKYIHIGLLQDKKLIKSEEKESFQNHSIYAMPLIETVLKQAGITVKELSQIEVINGPGSFTGVRIGVTIAKTLAYTLNIPIKTISSLEAYAVSMDKAEKIITTISDIKGVYFGIFNEQKELIKPLNYLSKTEFQEYIENNNLTNYLITESSKLNIEKIHEALEKVNSTNPHHVNPLYIKKIEVEKC